MLSETSISPSEVQGVKRKEETKVGGVLPMLSPGFGPAATIKTSQQARLMRYA